LNLSLQAKERAVFLSGRRSWGLLGAIGVVVVALGVMLPQLLTEAGSRETKVTTEKQSQNADLTYQPPVIPDVPSTSAMFARLALGTGIVLALCIGAVWVAKRTNGSLTSERGTTKLQVVESIQVGPRCSVVLLKADGRQVLVGMDSSGLKAIVALPEKFEEALQVAADEEAEVAPANVPANGDVRSIGYSTDEDAPGEPACANDAKTVTV
jgi:flagellar biogenesis protein FliO